MYREVLDRAVEGMELDRDDLKVLMSLTRDDELDALFNAASAVRDMNFGNKVFLYGFVYFSTFCKNNCAFCNYRRSQNMERYRKTVEEVVSLSGNLQDSGVNLVDLTMGEDPKMYSNGYSELVKMVSEVNDSVDIPIMLSPGALSKDAFPIMKNAGADWFACYQETHNRSLFEKLRLDQDYDHRFNQRSWARENGILTEDGIMVGIGETLDDRVDSILEMGRQKCDQVRVMTFVPQDGTPMSGRTVAGHMEELRTMAVMRLAYPDRLIPASLDVEGMDGLVPRLRAGANVVTSIIPPKMRLAGVAHSSLDIETGRRSVDHVFEMLDSAGHRAADNNDYMRYMNGRRASC